MATPPPVDTNNPRLESINRIKPGPRRYSNNQGQKQKAESISRSRTRARKTKPTHLLTGGGGGRERTGQRPAGVWTSRDKTGQQLAQRAQTIWRTGSVWWAAFKGGGTHESNQGWLGWSQGTEQTGSDWVKQEVQIWPWENQYKTYQIIQCWTRITAWPCSCLPPPTDSYTNKVIRELRRRRRIHFRWTLVPRCFWDTHWKWWTDQPMLPNWSSHRKCSLNKWSPLYIILEQSGCKHIK